MVPLVIRRVSNGERLSNRDEASYMVHFHGFNHYMRDWGFLVVILQLIFDQNPLNLK